MLFKSSLVLPFDQKMKYTSGGEILILIPPLFSPHAAGVKRDAITGTEVLLLIVNVSVMEQPNPSVTVTIKIPGLKFCKS